MGVNKQPMITGMDEYGSPWMAYNAPFSEYFFKRDKAVSEIAHDSDFRHMLLDVRFAEVYVGADGECCTADLFLYPHGNVAGVESRMKVEAEWADWVAPIRHWSVEDIVSPGMYGTHWKFQSSPELTNHLRKRGWQDHATAILRTALIAMFEVAHKNPTIPGIEWSMPAGTLTFEGDVPFSDIVEYFAFRKKR